MALETMKNINKVKGSNAVIVVMDELREKFPHKFNESGAMDYQWFEKDIRPHSFIYVRHDKNSLSFTLQNGPVKEVGVNGCQVTDIICLAAHIIRELNKKYPCKENAMTVTKLEEAIMWQNERTSDRAERGVEGTSNG